MDYVWFSWENWFLKYWGAPREPCKNPVLSNEIILFFHKSCHLLLLLFSKVRNSMAHNVSSTIKLNIWNTWSSISNFEFVHLPVTLILCNKNLSSKEVIYLVKSTSVWHFYEAESFLSDMKIDVMHYFAAVCCLKTVFIIFQLYA